MPENLLQDGLTKLKLNISSQKLLDYLNLLQKWNKHYNLTAITNYNDLICKHLLDSLTISSYLQGSEILDVGTGAGLPGVPLAIANMEFRFTLVDSSNKKIQFLTEVKRQLKLDNINLVNARVENLSTAKKFNTVLTRAMTNVNQLIKWTEHLINSNGIWLAMKAKVNIIELNQIPYSFEIIDYKVPNLLAQRCCVRIKNNKE